MITDHRSVTAIHSSVCSDGEKHAAVEGTQTRKYSVLVLQIFKIKQGATAVQYGRGLDGLNIFSVGVHEKRVVRILGLFPLRIIT